MLVLTAQLPEEARADDSEGVVTLIPPERVEQLSSYQRQVLEYNQRIQRQNNAPSGFPSFIRDKFDITVVAADYTVTPEGALADLPSAVPLPPA